MVPISEIEPQEITWEEICQFWKLYNTVKVYTPTSAYVFGGGIDKEYHKRTPIFVGVKIPDGTLIAAVNGHLTSPEYYRFRSLTVHHKYRRHGLGIVLMRRMEQEAAAAHAKYLWTMPGESYFHLVFEPYGFEKIGDWVYDGMHTPPNCYARKPIYV